MPDMNKILLILVVAALVFWALHKKLSSFDNPFDTGKGSVEDVR